MIPQKRRLLDYLTILFIFQHFNGGQCAVTLSQPPAMAAVAGSSVNLSCILEPNGENVNRVHVYWLIPATNNKVKEYLHPKRNPGSIRSDNARLLYPRYENDLSLTITDVQLSYSDMYVCETSLIIGGKSSKSTGRGTYLLVYEEFQTYMNNSDIICKVKVQSRQNLDISWQFQAEEYEDIDLSVTAATDNTYWMTSVLSNWTQKCKTMEKASAICRLQYERQLLVERSMELTCPEEFHTFINDSDVICKVKVRSPQDMDLSWKIQDEEYDNINTSVIPPPNHSHWITSIFSNWTQICLTKDKASVICGLQYKEHRLEESRVELPCTSYLQALHSRQQPTLLYTLFLSNTLFILFVVMIILYWVKKKRDRRIRIVAPYAKFSSIAQTRLND